MDGKFSRLAGPAYVANSATNIYNPSANTYAVIRKIRLANTDTVARTVTLYIGATGGSTGGTEYVKTISVPANDVKEWFEELRMDVADFLVGLCDSASKVTIIVTGRVYAL